MAQTTDNTWAEASAWLQHWFADDGAALRAWLITHTPEALHPILNAAPLWGLTVIMVAVGSALLWGVLQRLRKRSGGGEDGPDDDPGEDADPGAD